MLLALGRLAGPDGRLVITGPVGPAASQAACLLCSQLTLLTLIFAGHHCLTVTLIATDDMFIYI